MRKIMNDAKNFVPEVLEGIILAYGAELKTLGNENKVIVRNKKNSENKVAVVTAGGSGHLPVFLGYVGEGLLDGCAIGNVFASPSSKKMYEMIEAVDEGKGVLCLYGNYGGDVMNFEMACERAEMNGIKIQQVLVKDDVASRSIDEAEQRRGVAGMVYAFKVAGAAAKEGLALEEVARITRKALSNIRTMGVALAPCIVPEVGKPTFSIKEDELELGMGIHGEPGIEVCKLMSADDIAKIIMKKLIEDLPLVKGDEVSVMVNGLGATPLEEQLILYRAVFKYLEKLGVSIYMPHIGEFATSMEMAGCSITLFKLNSELKKYLRLPAKTPFYTNYNK